MKLTCVQSSFHPSEALRYNLVLHWSCFCVCVSTCIRVALPVHTDLEPDDIRSYEPWSPPGEGRAGWAGRRLPVPAHLRPLQWGYTSSHQPGFFMSAKGSELCVSTFQNVLWALQEQVSYHYCPCFSWR